MAQGIVSDQDLTPFLREKFAKWWSMVKLGYDGVMLERTQRQLKASEKITDIAMKGTTDGVDSLYPDNNEEDAMAVNIGNETHYHITYPSSTEVVPVDTTPATPPDTGGTIPPVSTNNTTTTTTDRTTIQQIPVPQPVTTKNNWLPLVLAVLAGMGGWGLAYYQSHKPVPTPTPVIDTDTDTDHETDVVFPQ